MGLRRESPGGAVGGHAGALEGAVGHTPAAREAPGRRGSRFQLARPAAAPARRAGARRAGAGGWAPGAGTREDREGGRAARGTEMPQRCRDPPARKEPRG